MDTSAFFGSCEEFDRTGSVGEIQTVHDSPGGYTALGRARIDGKLVALKWLQPFQEENYCEAIRGVQAAMDSYDPSVIGFRWDDENPRIQLEPRGRRGYIELRAVRRATE